jgi:Fic family protein
VPGWSWDGDDDDPRARLEAENSLRQARRLLELITDAVCDPTSFELTPAVICELNGIAAAGMTPNPGRLRTRDVEIFGSRHEPPTWTELPALIDELCTHVNQSDEDPVQLAAYVLWRLNWIHPFEEGNGRTARAIAYLVLCVALGQRLEGEVTLVERLSWQKIRYYRALEDADRAWTEGRLDVGTMTELLRELLEAQLETTS